MPRLVNGDYSAEAKQKGDTIDVPIPSSVAVVDVAPAITPLAAVDHSPSKVQVQLNHWKQNEPIHLTDNELVQIDSNAHYLPMELGEAIKGLAHAVNQSIIGRYKDTDLGVYGVVGTAGTTPFGSGVGVASATQARKLLNKQLCPRDSRRGVLDFDAGAAALELAAFSDAEKIMSSVVKIEGDIGRKFGIDWAEDDDVPLHTAGTLVDGASPTPLHQGAIVTGFAAGVSLVNIDAGSNTTLTGTLVQGDVVSFAGHTQTYVVIDNASSGNFNSTTHAYTAAANAISGLKIYPPLKAIVADNEIMTVKQSHRVNLIFHRDAFAFATRPLVDETQGLALGNRIISMQDPQTGLVLRLEVSRQHKQTCWEYDILWGDKLVRPELAVRLLG
jgi:hypothetical protein